LSQEKEENGMPRGGEKPGAAAEKQEAKTPEKQPKETAPQQGKAQEPKVEDAPESLRKELGDTQKKLKATEEQLASQKNLLLRTAAEYDNYRKRTQREKETVYADATAEAVREFLSVQDNLERALKQKDCAADDLRKGIKMVCRQMGDALKKLGVTEMGSEGETFDPALHNAVSHVEDKDTGENTITKVFQKGYQIGGKVIRHAMVQVAN
jgi:molecular chaperone GrpE